MSSTTTEEIDNIFVWHVMVAYFFWFVSSCNNLISIRILFLTLIYKDTNKLDFKKNLFILPYKDTITCDRIPSQDLFHWKLTEWKLVICIRWQRPQLEKNGTHCCDTHSEMNDFTDYWSLGRHHTEHKNSTFCIHLILYKAKMVL